MTLPFVREFFSSLGRRGPLAGLAEKIESAGGTRVSVSGLTPPAQLLATALLQRQTRRPVLLVVPDNRTAEEWRDTLATFADLTRPASTAAAGAPARAGHGQKASAAERDNDRPLLLPGFEIDPYEGISPHAEILEQRALGILGASESAPFVVLPAVALATKMAAPERSRKWRRRLRKGDFLDLEGCAEQLTAMGYQRQEPVEMPGQFSVRGGLLDVYSPESARPVRIELFGDEIESLREFDPGTQRSIAGGLSETEFLPLTSVPLDAELQAKLGDVAAPGWEFQVPGLLGYDHAIFDLPEKPLVLISEPAAVKAELERWWRRLELRYASAAGATNASDVMDGANSDLPAPLPPPTPQSIFFTVEELETRLSEQTVVELHELAVEHVDLGAETIELGGAVREAVPELVLCSRPSARYHGAITRMIEEIRQQLAQGEKLFFLGANPGEVERLGDLFTEYNVPFQFGSRPERSGGDYLAEKAYFSTEAPAAVVLQGTLMRGFSLALTGAGPRAAAPRDPIDGPGRGPLEPQPGSGVRLTVFSSNDLFQEDEHAAAPARAGRRSNVSSFLSDFRDLTPGDYVVHVEHGIGRYVGLKQFEGVAGTPDRSGGDGASARSVATSSAGAARAGEFMILEYAEGAKLYVPLTRMDLVQKYRSAEGAMPALDRMGGTQWAARKSRVKKAMQDMADELLKLYAARQAVHIRACAPDGNLQREFEDAFPYTETEDQQKAITDVRQDLETPRPMDRLIIGDVGYGKTEVAMRAAFKVVSEGRQVAVLAPTTVLAFQHEQTFRERFRAFPISIGLLSRFRSKAEQKATIEQLAHGKLDIVIGTHRLLSKDVKFHDLGLLVIDEEQRFGVRHKERMKHLRKEVHVLAMSATPIPRTLNMSLAGLRDMSVIETPPRDRLAIQTVVAGWNENLIGAAIEQELGRGGQLYFVHNRVDTIWDIAGMLQRLAPDARIAVGHGQMGEDELENVMMRFVRHEADILLSTTIIENGLDIPLANTIIINRADRLGLSELYQLRGRVGRSNRRAYAYLLVPAEAELTPIARKRLAAMREFSDLGAGFKIAALDLELRGGGNLLGGEQSGNLDAVGFDLYVKMLEQTVRELRGQTVEPASEIQLHLGLDLRIPPEYVAEENQRLRMYKRLAEAETEAARADVLKELEDRYGPPPAPVKNLLAFAALKPRCRALGVLGLERRGTRGHGADQLWLRFSPQSTVAPERLAALVEQTRGAQFSPDGTLKLPFGVNGAVAVLGEADRVLGVLEGAVAPARR